MHMQPLRVACGRHKLTWCSFRTSWFARCRSWCSGSQGCGRCRTGASQHCTTSRSSSRMALPTDASPPSRPAPSASASPATPPSRSWPTSSTWRRLKLTSRACERGPPRTLAAAEFPRARWQGAIHCGFQGAAAVVRPRRATGTGQTVSHDGFLGY
eukprot:1885922-Rhodomonas_salina.1